MWCTCASTLSPSYRPASSLLPFTLLPSLPLCMFSSLSSHNDHEHNTNTDSLHNTHTTCTQTTQEVITTYYVIGHVHNAQFNPATLHFPFSPSLPPSLSLQWDLEGLEDNLEQSKANLTHMISDSDLLVISTYGKKIPKQCKLSPDGWFQVDLTSDSV